MKSIKEKAEEFSFIEEGTDLNGNPYKDYNSYKMDGFEKGANYVLEEILDKTSKCITIKDAYEAFLECVEQLKK